MEIHKGETDHLTDLSTIIWLTIWSAVDPFMQYATLCNTEENKGFFFIGDQNSFPGDLLTTIGRQKATYKKTKLGALHSAFIIRMGQTYTCIHICDFQILE